MPITTKAGPMPTHQRLRTDDGEDVQDRREPSVELDEKPTVGVRQPRPTLHLAPQNNQLLPERCILRLKSALRLEWRSQDAQHKEDQRYHAVRIADSLAPPTRMRFSAHTPFSQHKIKRGGKGVGRLGWLKVFDTINVNSHFMNGSGLKAIEFDFVLRESNQIDLKQPSGSVAS